MSGSVVIPLSTCKEILEWIKPQDLPQNTFLEITLPEHLAHQVADKKVYLVKETGGVYYFLLKTEIGWKGNFKGTFYRSKALDGKQIVQQQGSKAYISLIGYPVFEELYLEKELDDNRCLVYFDLN